MPRELKTDPKNTRARLRRSGGRLNRDVEILASHRKPLDEWDMEELARGRPRASDGTFRGAPPTWISAAVTAEAKKRLKTLAADEMAASIGSAIQVIRDLMTSDEIDDEGRPIVDARTRLDAAKFVVEHTLGKAKQRVDIDATDDAKNALLGALMIPDGKGGYTPAHPVIDGTFTEGKDDDDELL